jgi:monofunctional biosynthetic peptidoglycan transglycosylase
MDNGMNKTATDSGASRNETTGRTSWTRRLLRGGQLVLRTAWFAILFFVLSTVAVVLLYRFVPPPLTPLMVLRLIDQVRADEPLTLKKDWTPLSRISPWMPAAVIASEDQRFYEHHGFDFKAIEKARRHNERVRERAIKSNGGRGARAGKIRGASTISQQTAKNVFLWPARSWTRKGLEVWFTFLMETLWSKERILEVYLNVAEMGDGIYGAQAAARRWFDKDASNLTRSQAALLAAILPRPRAWSPLNPPRRVANRQQWILRQLAGGPARPTTNAQDSSPASTLPDSDAIPSYPSPDDSWEFESEDMPETVPPSPPNPASGNDAVMDAPEPVP